MPRIRSLKPEIWASPEVQRLSIPAVLLFIGLITQADDEGRGCADPLKLRATIFPNRRNVNIEKLILEVMDQGLVVRYADANRAMLYCLPSWHRHQKISHAGRSNYQAPPQPPPEGSGGLRIVPVGSDLTGSDLTGSDRKGSDPDRKGSGRARDRAPNGSTRAGEEQHQRRRQAELAAAGQTVEQIRREIAGAREPTSGTRQAEQLPIGSRA